MQEKLKLYIKNFDYKMLNDTRVLGLIAFGVIAVLVSWSGVKSIQTNYELQKQISELNQQNGVLKLQNDNQKLRNEYYKTDQFLELAARRQFGKAAPGEKVFIVPKNVAMANTIELPKPEAKPTGDISDKPTYQKNLESWYRFFFHQKLN